MRTDRVPDFSRLDQPVQFLRSVGPARAEALQRMGIVTARDLLFHLPRRYDDATTVRPIGVAEVGADTTILGRVRSRGIVPTRAGLRIFQAILQDDSGMITCAWPGQPWLDRRIREGDLLLASGPVRFFHGRQMQPREFTIVERGSSPGEGPGAGSLSSGRIYVTWPASEEVPQWVIRGIFERNLDRLLPLIEEEETLSPADRSGLGLPTLRAALEALHRPRTLEEAEAGRRRLAWEELFFLQIVQAVARHRESRTEPGLRFERTNERIRPLHQGLGFPLTGAQTRVLREIYADLLSGDRMNRFLQGDVGAGKTLVALFALLLARESGFQGALMAPTELLAEQHAAKIRELLQQAGISETVVLLSGRIGTRERRERLAQLAIGEAGIAVGTHALIQDGVSFRTLGLVIVDEQHRFGVRQRMALVEGAPAGARPHVLVMSATPIPRSLAMVLYGDLDLSVLDELPPGRTPVRTHLRTPSKRDEVWARVERELAQGRQGYIVYPLVEESDHAEGLRSATGEFERLSTEVFPHRRLGLLHGQLPADEKDRVMRAFRDHELDLLVATSVIEVGIDVPNATVMVIEHAERFGLSQLHQLRGRVGRGAAESICILLHEGGEGASQRLKVFRDTNDGYEIARADLRIRGQGDLFGSQQHGRDPLLRVADLSRDEELLGEARRRARALVAADPELERPEQARVRQVLEKRHAERLSMWRVG